MPIQSMTGFARFEGRNDDAKWVWEVRSVNGKGLDFRLRTPPGMDNLQPHIRKILAKSFSRGNLQINLALEREENISVPVINHEVLGAVIEAINTVQENIDCRPPSPEQILSIKGVMEQGSSTPDRDKEAVLERDLLRDFQYLVDELVKARTNEGTAVVAFLRDQISQIETQTRNIIKDPSRSLENIKTRLNTSVSLLLDNTTGLDLDRLHQEAAILAAKADLQEELDRLVAHTASAREILASEGPVGRKLDFLCQEFNRECNTICSKSNSSRVTAIGLDMKVVIDQLREQVQNLE